jgi:hypothetical protein
VQTRQLALRRLVLRLIHEQLLQHRDRLLHMSRIARLDRFREEERRLIRCLLRDLTRALAVLRQLRQVHVVPEVLGDLADERREVRLLPLCVRGVRHLSRRDVDHVRGDADRAMSIAGEVAANHPLGAEDTADARRSLVVDASGLIELLRLEHAVESRGLDGANSGVARELDENELRYAAAEGIEHGVLVADDAVREGEGTGQWPRIVLLRLESNRARDHHREKRRGRTANRTSALHAALPATR